MSEKNKPELESQLRLLMHVRHNIYAMKNEVQLELERAPQPEIQSSLRQAVICLMAAQKDITASIGEISIQLNS